MTNVQMTLRAVAKDPADFMFDIPVSNNDNQQEKRQKEIHSRIQRDDEDFSKPPLAQEGINENNQNESFSSNFRNRRKRNVPISKNLQKNSHITKLVLLRAIGNPLPPRHDPEQAYQNLRFTLEHERDFPHLRKHWILNRLVDTNVLQRLRSLLDQHGQNYTLIPFDLSEYEKVSYNFTYYQPVNDVIHTREYIDQTLKGYYQIDEAINQDKNLFVTNQNAARNFMIDIGISTGEDWILPWDGNCFVHPKAYAAIYNQLKEMPENKNYAYTPMNRAQENKEVLLEDYQPDAIEEPQVILRRSANARFHPLLRYGRRNKVEFLQRLKVKGKWDHWTPYLSWEKKNLGPFFTPIVDMVEPTPKIGWVTRLSSGQQHLEKKGTIHERGQSRLESMDNLLGKLDTRVAVELYGFKPGHTLLYFHSSALKRDRRLYEEGNASVKNIVDKLIILANKALTCGPWSVMDKPDDSVAASGDKHDYFHLSPYYWPPSKEAAKNPNSVWKRRDGKRYPGTSMHGPGSNNFDRSRLSDMQYNTTILSLAFFMTGKDEYAQVAARNIRTWFFAPESRMNPNMKYAQVITGKNNNTGQSFGIIEAKDFYFFLDAIHLIEESKFLNKNESSELRSWFQEYLDWLETSKIGKEEYLTKNNHGLYYDIQATSIASFVSDTAKMIKYIERSTSRMLAQISENGKMIEEIRRPTCEHYQIFTLQGWSTLARIAKTVNRDLWLKNGKLLCNAARYSIPFLSKRPICKSKVNQTNIDVERWLPLLLDAEYHCPQLRKQKNAWPSWFPSYDQIQPSLIAYQMPVIYDTHDGIAPFWNLGLYHANFTLSSLEQR